MQEKPNSQVTLRAAGGVPELEQVADRAARRGDHRVAVLRFRIEGLDQLALAHRLSGLRGVGIGRLDLLPLGLQLGDLRLPVGEVHASLPARRCQGGERLARVGDDRQRSVLEGVVGVDVDAHEAHVRVVEQAVGGGGEVPEPGAHGDHQVGLLGRTSGRGGALDAMSAQRPLARAAITALARRRSPTPGSRARQARPAPPTPPSSSRRRRR